MSCKGDMEPMKIDVEEYVNTLKDCGYKAETTGTYRLRRDSHSEAIIKQYEEYCASNALPFPVAVVEGPEHKNGSDWYEIEVGGDSPFRYLITDRDGEPIGVAVFTPDDNGNMLGNFIHDNADCNERTHEYLDKYHHIVTGKACGRTKAERFVADIKRRVGPNNVEVVGTRSSPDKPDYGVTIRVKKDSLPPVEDADQKLKDLGLL